MREHSVGWDSAGQHGYGCSLRFHPAAPGPLLGLLLTSRSNIFKKRLPESQKQQEESRQPRGHTWRGQSRATPRESSHGWLCTP